MSLKEKIAAEIKKKGAVTIERYMSISLSDPTFGYYTSKLSRIGKTGDFITSPELSQVFGELIGLWLAQTWVDRGQLRPFNLVELGPGNGTLMADVLNIAKHVPNFLEAASLILIEKSEKLKAQQKTALGRFEITWLTNVEDIPDRPTFVIANEFFDALPIRQFVKLDRLWKERCVGLDEKENLVFCHKPAVPNQELQALYPNLPNNVYVETSDSTISIVSSLAKKVAKNQGVILITDYGCLNGVGDTLQAVFHHSFSDPLLYPGEADLTAHVNFSNIAATAEVHGLRSSSLCTQRNFLMSLGILSRASTLEQKMSIQNREMHRNAVNKLIDSDKMGEIFKVMALTSKNSPNLPILD